MLKKILLFLVLNFSALGIGSIYTKTGVASDWYQTLHKAPWTPPGYVFGVAWFTIMSLFAIYMGNLITLTKNYKKVIILYIIQLIFNIFWNPIFFYFKQTKLGLLFISILTITITFLLFDNYKLLKSKSLFLAPYFLWLLIATSLNLYIVFYN